MKLFVFIKQVEMDIRKTNLCIVFLLISMTAFAQSFNTSYITDQNRSYKGSSAMFGGWGPHLRSIMRSSDGSIWMAIDGGPSVYANDYVTYYKYDELQNIWINNGVNNHPNYEVQQNMAHLMQNDTIYSYGIEEVGIKSNSVVGNRMVEIKYSTLTGVSTISRLNINGSVDFPYTGCNYVGAVINKSNGLKVVWWNRSKGIPSSIGVIWKYPDQANWNGPYEADEIVNGNNYNIFTYVYGAFTDDNTLELTGQSGLWTFNPNTDVYVPAYTQINFTKTTALHKPFTWLGGNGGAANYITDLWVNPCNNDLHVLAYSFTGKTIYYYKPDTATVWTSWQNNANSFNWRYYSKFSYDNYLDTLTMVSSSGNYIYTYKLKGSQITGMINWAKAIKDSVHVGSNMGTPCAIYVQRASQQTDSATRFQFAVVGEYPTYDSIVKYFKPTYIDLKQETINSCDTSLFTLTKDYSENSKIHLFPNPFSSETTLIIDKEYRDSKVVIVDILGNVIEEIELKNTNEIVINRGKLSNGTYLLKIVSPNTKTLFSKMVIID